MAIVIIGSLTTIVCLVTQHGSRPPVELRGSSEVLTIASTGDWSTHGGWTPAQHDALAGVSKILRSSSLGLTNLEETLLDHQNGVRTEEQVGPHRQFGTRRDAEEMRRLGMTAVSLANNHAMDYGEEGMKDTERIIEQAGLLHVGSGTDLQLAGTAAMLGASPTRVAVIGVTTSAEPESRATQSQGEILGRPGVNVVRYAPQVTVDASTFATLKGSSLIKPVLSADPKSQNELMLSGIVITKGEKTAVTFMVNKADGEEVLKQVRLARSRSNVVIVMLHSHEPGDESQVPSDFVKEIARSLIDAGANLVVGSGPHQLRGIELHNEGVIFYSLGNFALDDKTIDPNALDVYDSGIDLLGLILGSAGDFRKYPQMTFAEPMWWQSVIAIATYRHGALASIRLQPLDLGTGQPIEMRGMPRIAAQEEANEILQRLARLSRSLGTVIRIQDGVGFIDLDHPAIPHSQLAPPPNTSADL